MQITETKITVKALTEGYKDNDDEGVVGYGGRLDIRPPYQREFIYGDRERDAVIDTLQKGYPLNVMYWAVKDDGNYEIIDGQQRTISICQFVKGEFSFNRLKFHNLPDDTQEKILDYELTVYLCSGKTSEKLAWFKTINIAGKTLTDQELLNASFAGPWVTDAKRYFSRRSRPKLGDDYMAGSAIRQDYLETVINWISGGNIENHMSDKQFEPDASELWLYYKKVIDWVETKFPVKRKKEMQGLPWGVLYNKYKDAKLDAKKLEAQIAELMRDEDVENKRGIYQYVLTGEEKHLNIRAFSDKMKREAYERQKGVCVKCRKKFEIGEMEGDHIKPWHEGGATTAENCQMLCRDCNRRKSGK